jgi:[protein-PII] uridylyltransferase
MLLRRLADPSAFAGLRATPSPLPRVTTRRNARTAIRFSEDPSGSRTIVEVETADQPGVLRRITQAFGGLGIDIEIARLASEAKRVYDVFYVKRLDDPTREALSARLQEVLRRG